MNLGSLVSAVAGLFAGTVSLGGIDLVGLEIPEKLAWGGEQRIVTHRLPGGAKQFDLMGADDADITFTGYFSGAGANYQARTFDGMRIAGKPVTLSWPGFTRQVLISKFACSSERGGYLLPYSVTCVVIPAAPGPATPSLLGQIANDIGDALGIPDLMGTVTPVLADAQDALRTVQSVLPVVGVLTGGSSAFVAVSGALTSAQGVFAAGLGTAQESMGGVLSASAATGTLLGTGSPISAVANLGSTLANAAGVAGLLNMGGLLNRSTVNVTNAGA